MNTKIVHGAYRALRLAKEQKMDKRTRLGSALSAIEKAIFDHFEELNNLQQIELFNLLPLIAFLLNHPLTNEQGGLCADYKWIWLRVENGLKVLVELADKKHRKAPRLSEIINAGSK